MSEAYVTFTKDAKEAWEALDLKGSNDSPFSKGKKPSSYEITNEAVTANEATIDLTVKNANGDSQDIVLDNLPAGKKLKSSDGTSVFTALSGLRCDDVKKKSGVFAFDREYVCRLKDSTVYTLQIAQKDDKTYASVTAEFTDKTPVEMVNSAVTLA